MIRLFVYGTLRPGTPCAEHKGAGHTPSCTRCTPGGELADNLRWSYADEPRLARVRGRLYVNPDSERTTWQYPVLVTPGAVRPDDWVTGHLLTLFDDENVRRTVLMELQAGYEARHLTVISHNGLWNERALTFTWPEHERLGRRITSGDWFEYSPPRTTNHKENAPGT